jgi:hypothetical protein
MNHRVPRRRARLGVGPAGVEGSAASLWLASSARTAACVGALFVGMTARYVQRASSAG